MNLRKKKKILFIVTLVLFLIVVVVEVTCNTTISLIVALSALVSMTVLDIRWKRCPHCNEYLGRYLTNAPYCKHCGEKLYEE